MVSEAQEAASNDYRRWGEQPERNPHDAAHHGLYAFKTPRPLVIVDNGIEPYVGSSILNGAHLQGEMQYPPAQELTALQRFGDLTPARVGLALMPLLVILLAFGAFAGEREQGTLRQLLSQGVHPRDLLWGKAAGIGAALAIVLIPVALVGFLIASVLAPPAYRMDELGRAALLALVYGAYLAIFLFLTLGVSARCRSSRATLIILLAFWGVSVFAAPRAFLDLGGRLHPVPSNVDYWKGLMTDLWSAWNDGETALKQKLLAQYKVEKVEDLPFDYTGLSMQVGDDRGDAVVERYIDERFGVYGSQSRLLEEAAFLSPSIGVSLLSMALAGGDLVQHRDFIRQVESYRRGINRQMNQYISDHQHRGAQGWETAGVTGDQTLWESIPPFTYEPPTALTAAKAYPFAWGALALWLITTLAFARRSIAKLSGA